MSGARRHSPAVTLLAFRPGWVDASGNPGVVCYRLGHECLPTEIRRYFAQVNAGDEDSDQSLERQVHRSFVRMPEQLAFTGFGTTQRPTDRVFLAIFPDVDAAAHMARLARHVCSEHGLKGKPLAAERFHVTLLHLGDYVGLPREVVAAASEAAANVTFPPFEIVFDRVVSFVGRPRSRPFVLRGGDGVAALIAFQKTLGSAIAIAGLGCWVTPHYTPHVTLLYDDRRVSEQTVETIGWTAQEFVLVHSLLGKTRHVPLARWRLRG